MFDVRELPKISADAHVNEPHDLWWNRLPEDLRELAPARIQAENDGGWSLVVNGEITPTTRQITDEEDIRREAETTIEARLAMLHEDGLHGEMVYPTIGLYSYRIDDPAAGIAACLVYNDWIHEHLGDDCPRVRYAGLVPTWTVESAIAEVQRLAAWRGIGALMLPLVGSPPWNDAQWAPLWAAVAETGLPIVMHQGTGHDMIFYRGWGSPTTNLLTTQSMAPRTAALLSCSGVLARHPDLHVVLVEVNAGWMAWTMSTLDEYFLAHNAQARKPHLPESPSHYLRHQVHATFQRDPIAIATRAFTGVECLMWGNDFPHDEGTFPNSEKVLTDLLDGVEFAEAAQISGGNAHRVFNFDSQILANLP